MYIGKTQSDYTNPFFRMNTQFSGSPQDATSIGRRLGGYQSSGSMFDMSGLMTQMMQMQMMIKMFEKMGFDMGDLGAKKTEKAEETEKAADSTTTATTTATTTPVEAKNYKVADGGEKLSVIAEAQLKKTVEGYDKLSEAEKKAKIAEEEKKLYELNPKDIKGKLAGKTGAYLDKALDEFTVAGKANLLLNKKAAKTTVVDKATTNMTKMKNGNSFSTVNNDGEIVTSEYNKTGDNIKEFTYNKADKKVYYKFNGEQIPCETKINEDGSYTAVWKDESKNLSYERSFNKVGIPLKDVTKIGDKKKAGAEVNSVDLSDSENITLADGQTGTVVTERGKDGMVLTKFRVSNAGHYEFLEGGSGKGLVIPKGYTTPEGVERRILTGNSQKKIVFVLDENYKPISKKEIKIGEPGTVIESQELFNVDEQRAEIEAKMRQQHS